MESNELILMVLEQILKNQIRVATLDGNELDWERNGFIVEKLQLVKKGKDQNE